MCGQFNKYETFFLSKYILMLLFSLSFVSYDQTISYEVSTIEQQGIRRVTPPETEPETPPKPEAGNQQLQTEQV